MSSALKTDFSRPALPGESDSSLDYRDFFRQTDFHAEAHRMHDDARQQWPGFALGSAQNTTVTERVPFGLKLALTFCHEPAFQRITAKGSRKDEKVTDLALAASEQQIYGLMWVKRFFAWAT